MDDSSLAIESLAIELLVTRLRDSRGMEELHRRHQADPNKIDEQLLMLYYGGEHLALDALYALHGDRLRGQARACLRNRQNADDSAWDVAQETWLRVARTCNAPSSRWQSDRGPVKPWLDTILRNIIRDRFGDARQYLPLPEDDGGTGVSLEGGEEDPAAQGEHIDLWRACLGQLSGVDRRILELLYVDGLSQTEIARELSRSDSFVSQHLSVIWERLRTFLVRQGITRV